MAARRREQAIVNNTTTIKTGFKKFCKDPNLATLIEGSVPYLTHVAIEASMLRTFHTIRCCERGIPLDEFNITFFNRSLIAIGPTGLDDPQCKASPALRESLRLYRECRPADYHEMEPKKPFMRVLFDGQAQMDHVNFKNWFSGNFKTYLCWWIRAHLNDYHYTTGCLLGANKYVKSTVSLIAAAATNEDGDVDALLASSYERLHDPELGDEEKDLMKGLVQLIREKLFQENSSPTTQPLLPLKLSEKTFHLYMPVLHRILLDLEARYNQKHHDCTEEICSIYSPRRESLLFPLMPQKSFKATHLHISNTVLVAMVKELAKNPQLNQAYYKNKLKTLTGEALFAEFFNLGTVINRYGEPSARKHFGLAEN